MSSACASVGANCDVRDDQWPVLCQVQEEEEEEGVSRLTGLSQTRPLVADVTLRRGPSVILNLAVKGAVNVTNEPKQTTKSTKISILYFWDCVSLYLLCALIILLFFEPTDRPTDFFFFLQM